MDGYLTCDRLWREAEDGNRPKAAIRFRQQQCLIWG
jgi:hypothetical protein